MLRKAFGTAAISKSRCYGWYREFKGGRKFVEDLPRAGRPTTSTNDEHVEKIKQMRLKNMSIREMARQLNISPGTVQRMLSNILNVNQIQES